MPELQKQAWEESYDRYENFLFYPNEYVIRFISKFVRQRTDINHFEDQHSWNTDQIRVLSIGCGIGRHVFYAEEMGCQGYGIDLSGEAISKAREWARHRDKPELADRFKEGNAADLPWSDNFFHVVISHGVFDSMTFEVARRVIPDVRRTMVDDGLFYCDVMSGDDHKHGREFAEEEKLNRKHEQNTIQSYFNYAKIQNLVEGYFSVIEGLLVRRQNLQSPEIISRYHLALEPD